MKKKKLTALTLMLATAVVSTALGGAVLANNALADADTYTISEIFSATNATLGTETLGEGESANKVTAFTLKDDGSVSIKRSLALKWYAEKGTASYFSTTFAFKELNFKSVTLAMDTASAWATKDEKTTNTVTFTNDSDGIKVAVNGGEAKEVTIEKGQKLTLSLTESTDKDGEFGVKLSGISGEIGKFTNIGANYAEYSSNEKYPLKISAELAEAADDADEASAVVLLYAINGQSFDGLTSDDKITDDAAPVLVVNENVNGFLLGTAFALDYTAVDVLKSKSLTNTLEYYQYNPNLKDGDENFEKYKTLSTSVYFMDTVCYVKDGQFVAKDTEGAKTTSVFKQKGKELVSITLKTSDGSNEKKYDLAWYANDTETIDEIAYIPVDRNQDGATYTYIQANKATGENKIVNETEYTSAKEAFEESLAEAAKDVYAGSNSYIYFPSFKWMIGDNNGYRNLRFTISYKTPSADSASTSSNLSYNALKLSASSAGKYEFKIFANDKAGNTMQYYLDGELVSVSASNVWDIEEIPSFTFEIENKGLKIEDGSSVSSRKDTQILDKTYNLDSIDVVGANNLKEDYKLFKVDRSKYNDGLDANKQLTAADLYAVTYEQIQSKIDLKKIGDYDDYFDMYLTAYASALAQEVGATAAADIEKIKSCFIAIDEYDSRITEENAASEWEAYNKYHWNPESRSFKTVEEGSYLILADYWESELAASQRVAAYKVIVVQSKADVIEGDNNWLKDNVVSVVLFSIAGVMLILIIILLLIKPSDETLEDVDAAAAKTKEKKNKKNKKEN